MHSYFPSGRGCQLSSWSGLTKSNGPVLIGGVGVSVVVGEGVAVGVAGVTVNTGCTDMGVWVGGNHWVGVGGSVSCDGEVAEASGVRVEVGASGVGVGALQASILPTSPTNASVIIGT